MSKNSIDYNDKVKVDIKSGSLDIHLEPGAEQYLVGKVADGEILTLLSKTNKQWWYVRTAEGVEGYCETSYLEAIKE